MVSPMKRWKGKVAIVIGASSVVGVARRSELVEKRTKKCSLKKGKLHAYKADITQEQEVVKLFEWTTKKLGPVHILINSAGTGIHSSLTEGNAEDWKTVLDLNVLSVCIATREAVKIMKEKKINGHIIHINGVLGHKVTAMPGLHVLPASKFAITALTETLRQEFNHLGLKIKITSVSPGLVESELTTQHKNPEIQALMKQMPILKSEDIADGVIFALSTPEHVQIHELTIKPVGEQF